ncbi:MAG: class I SAM-dependent methyltransferase [Actinomycetota bacterium]|nr:class I SAM-dependent methyltransferase [Actinomycetota bacterium]
MSADYCDGWYRDMAGSAVKDALWDRLLGLPPGLGSTSLLTGPALDDVAELLALRPGELLLDLACGRGGYGRELARRTGARVVGVDLSGVAVAEARRRALREGVHARYAVGTLTATGLADGAVDAVVCVDALQFAGDLGAALHECRRALRPGGRLVATSWEAEPDDEQAPARLRGLRFAPALDAALRAGAVVERPDWRERELAAWREVVAIDPGDDPALRSLHHEGVQTLRRRKPVRRVLLTARR